MKPEIKENLKRVKQGKPLTIPLAILNGEFKEEYKKKFGEFARYSIPKSYMKFQERICLVCEKKFKTHQGNKKICSRKCYRRYIKKKRREYNQRPEVKKKRREYNQRPEVKKKKREYNQRPEVKKKKREYNQKPEVKKKYREYMRKRNKIPKSRWRVK